MTAGVGAGVYHVATPSFVSSPKRLQNSSETTSTSSSPLYNKRSTKQSRRASATAARPEKRTYQCIHPQCLPRQRTAVLSSVW